MWKLNKNFILRLFSMLITLTACLFVEACICWFMSVFYDEVTNTYMGNSISDLLDSDSTHHSDLRDRSRFCQTDWICAVTRLYEIKSILCILPVTIYACIKRTKKGGFIIVIIEINTKKLQPFESSRSSAMVKTLYANNMASEDLES